MLTCIPADLVTTSGVTRGLGSGPGDTSAGRPGFLPLQKMVATNLSRGFVVFCAASALSIIISFNGFFSDQHEDIGHKHVAVSGSFICFAAMWLAAIFGLLAVELPDSCVNFSDRKKKVGIFMLILLCAQRPSAEASESRWTGRASGYPSTFRNTYPKSEGRPPGTSAREPSFFHAAFQMDTIRLRGGAGEGTVIYEKVIHHVKGAAVKAKASKLPDGSYSCIFTYDGNDPLTLQVPTSFRFLSAAVPARIAAPARLSAPPPPRNKSQSAIAAIYARVNSHIPTLALHQMLSRTIPAPAIGKTFKRRRRIAR